MINNIWLWEVDATPGHMLKAGDMWGNVDVTNPSYVSPAYFRAFGEVAGTQADWNLVVESSYRILAASLNTTSGNARNAIPTTARKNQVRSTSMTPTRSRQRFKPDNQAPQIDALSSASLSELRPHRPGCGPGVLHAQL